MKVPTSTRQEFRSQKNPYTVVEVPHTSQKAVVWCGMHKNGINSSFFFTDSAVTGESYKSMLYYCAMVKVLDLRAYTIFRQDRAFSHWFVQVRSYLDT